MLVLSFLGKPGTSGYPYQKPSYYPSPSYPSGPGK